MTAIEDRLQGLTSTVLPVDLPSAGEIVERGGRRRRRRRSVGTVALAALVVAGSALATRLLDDDTPTTVTAAEGSGADPDPNSTPDGPADAAHTLVVPDVVGLDVAEATSVLADLGLVSATVADSGSISVDEFGRVLAQNPTAGTTVRRGDTVTLVYAPSPRSADRTEISGFLLDGRVWVVVNDPADGLCVTLGDEDLGCDDVGPVVAPDADPATPRIALARDAETMYSGSLLYGFLPPSATRVDLVHADGRITSSPLTVEPDEQFWAIPVDPADNPVTVVYRDDAGVEIARFTL